MKLGDIILVPFPFSDLSSQKVRPAVIVSNKSLKGNTVIICAISSQSSGISEVQLTNSNLDNGQLPITSYVKTDRIVTLHKELIKKIVATVSQSTLTVITDSVKSLIG